MPPRVSVFKSQSQLVELGTQLYGSQESQKRGLAYAKALQTRGQLPASVHLTCLLVAAIHGDLPQNDLYTIRLSYSMALIRFVNEILDAGQQSKMAVPLHALAKTVDLPNSFVELRHAATHENLPSIYLLRDMANRAMSWLYDKFWSVKFAETQSNTVLPSHAPTEFSKLRTKELLKQWRRDRRQGGSPDDNEITSELRTEFIAAHETGFEPDFFDLVLKYIVPSTPKPTTPATAKSSLKLWLPLINALPSEFFLSFTKVLISKLGQLEWPVFNASSQPHEQAVLTGWLEELAPLVDDRSIVAGLMESPRPWNARTLALWAYSHDEDLVHVAEAMAQAVNANLPPRPADIVVKETQKRPKHGIWKVVEPWTPRPIGIGQN